MHFAIALTCMTGKCHFRSSGVSFKVPCESHMYVVFVAVGNDTSIDYLPWERQYVIYLLLQCISLVIAARKNGLKFAKIKRYYRDRAELLVHCMRSEKRR